MSNSRSLDDAALVEALIGLREDIAWPTTGAAPDLARRVRMALVAGEAPYPAVARRPWWRAPRRALVAALVALLALSAVAGAVGLGLPGLRLVLGGPSTSASLPPVTAAPPGPATSPTAPGGDLGLGELVTLQAARTRSGRPIPALEDVAVGPPDAIYLDQARADQVALVWSTSATLPETHALGVGLIVMSFDGTVEPAFFQKALGPSSTVEPVEVAGQRGFWISGDPHTFFYVADDGTIVDDQRRWVGDALIWSDGSTTYRIETAQGRDAALDLAASIAGGATP